MGYHAVFSCLRSEQVMRRPNHYEILGVSCKASDSEIRHAHIAKQVACYHHTLFHHSGKKLHIGESMEQSHIEVDFKQAQKAYNILSDPAARAQYDNELFGDKPCLNSIQELREKINYLWQDLDLDNEVKDAIHHGKIDQIRKVSLIDALIRLTEQLKQEGSKHLKVVITLAFRIGRLIDKLSDIHNDPVAKKKLFIDFAKEYVEHCEIQPEGFIFWNAISHILHKAIDVNLYELKLVELEEEIDRINKAFSKPQDRNKKSLCESLQAFIDACKKDARLQVKSGDKRESILSSPAVRLSSHVTDMLQQLQYKPVHAKHNRDVINHYKTNYQREFKHSKGLARALKTSFTLALAAVEALICGSIGLVMGLFSKPIPIIGAPLCMFDAMRITGRHGIQVGKQLTAIPQYERLIGKQRGREIVDNMSGLLKHHALLPPRRQTTESNSDLRAEYFSLKV